MERGRSNGHLWRFSWLSEYVYVCKQTNKVNQIFEGSKLCQETDLKLFFWYILLKKSPLKDPDQFFIKKTVCFIVYFDVLKFRNFVVFCFFLIFLKSTRGLPHVLFQDLFPPKIIFWQMNNLFLETLAFWTSSKIIPPWIDVVVSIVTIRLKGLGFKSSPCDIMGRKCLFLLLLCFFLYKAHRLTFAKPN